MLLLLLPGMFRHYYRNLTASMSPLMSPSLARDNVLWNNVAPHLVLTSRILEEYIRNLTFYELAEYIIITYFFISYRSQEYVCANVNIYGNIYFVVRFEIGLLRSKAVHVAGYKTTSLHTASQNYFDRRNKK